MKVYVEKNNYVITYQPMTGIESLEDYSKTPIIVENIADYTKQVRKEVCEKIQSELLDFTHKHWRVFNQNGKQYMTDDDLIECLNEIISQIQGETK